MYMYVNKRVELAQRGIALSENVCIIVIIRYIHTNTAQTSTVITNNGSKTSKYRPESYTQ